MRNLVGISFLFCSLLGGSLALNGCSSADYSKDDPAALYNDAEGDIKSDRYIMALEKLRIVKNKFPYSAYSTKAQLRIADVYFLQESFLEAAAAYETFRDLHPRHEQAPYAMYRSGESYFQDAPSNVARDLTSATKSLQAFEEFVKVYPTDPQNPTAKTRIQEVKSILAEKELYIANFYYREDQYLAAETRYKKIISQYPDTVSANAAREKLAKISEERE